MLRTIPSPSARPAAAPDGFVPVAAARGGAPRRAPHRSTRTAPALGLSLLVLLGACRSGPPPAPPPAPAPEYWSHSRVVETADGMITLFDPADLAHHAADPEHWYRHRFAIADDLATGRIAAVLGARGGRQRVRVTSAPLDARERALAGPEATLRLRVRDRRLLLAGGDAWPSVAEPRPAGPFDERWLAIPDGDYRVRITALDTRRGASHDAVFRLEEVGSIDEVEYAPGIPRLVVGERAGVAGVGPEGLRLAERCAEVPPTARWSPLVGTALPVPGQRDAVVELIEPLHERGRALQVALLPDEGPLVVAREARVGALGMQLTPREWLPPRWERGRYRELFEVRGRTDCAVRVTGIDGLGAEARLAVEPLPMARDPLPPALARALAERFDAWIARSSDPAWRYKSGRVRNAPDPTSLTLGVLHQLDLPAAEVESLLLESNQRRAERLLDYMGRPGPI